MLVDTAHLGGMGSTGFGTFFGSGGGGSWGLFDATLRAARIDTRCENCERLRTSKTLGSSVILGVYTTAEAVFIAASDIGNIGCLSVEFSGPGGTYTAAVNIVPGPPPPIVVDTPVTLYPEPMGDDLIDTLLTAVLPEVGVGGEYLATLVDRCGDYTVDLATITLEAAPMIFTAHNADLGGAPQAWLTGGSAEAPAGHPASGSRVSIPFDYCTSVVEYDARLGTLPDAQGWVYGGAGSNLDYSLVPGGALRAATALTSYWTKTTPMSVPPDKCYSYAVLNATGVGGVGVGTGLDFESRYATAIAAPYHGTRFGYRSDEVYFTKLDGSGHTTLWNNNRSPGWVEVAVGDSSTGSEIYWDQVSGFAQSGLYGTVGAAGAVETVCKFGDTTGTGITALVRNFVSSFPGRFIRAAFTGFTQVATPKLRLYLAADTNASTLKSARFRVTYGQGTANPYAGGALVAETTVNFTTANTVLEAALNLSGLTANTPIWFTVERLAGHSDDKLEATVHMFQATLRVI